MKALVIASAVVLATCSLYAKEYHVSPAGSDTNPGSKPEPFKTISAAAVVAQPGDVITVHAGVYRERVNPPRGGISNAKRIIYQAASGETVTIRGSEVIKGWKKVQDAVWKVTLPNRFFGDFNPYKDEIGGEWYNTPRDGFNRHTGAVYLNGQWLDESPSLTQVLNDAQAASKDKVLGGQTAKTMTHDRAHWYAKVDEETTTIWAQFKDVNPNQETVEINVRQSVFYPDQPGRNYITVRGFAMSQAATPWSGAMSEQIGLIGTHWSRGWVIEGNRISYSMNTGITLGRYDLGQFGVAVPPATAPGFVRSCELAMEHGWSKKSIGGHVVRNNHISHCEKNGIHGSLGGIFSLIEGNALKLLGSLDTLIRDNHIYRCKGAGGVWLDWMAQGTRMTGNLLHDNSQDLFVEVNHGPFLIDHNLLLSSRSLRDWSQGGAYAHNLMAGSVAGRKENRETPFFKLHTVKDMQLSNI